MRLALSASLLCLALPCLQTPALAQTGAKNGEWSTYGGDLGNTRYSPLSQIDATNFSKLQLAWRFNTVSLGPRPEYNLEATPLMVGGVLYSVAGARRDVVALDATNGELLWVHGENEGKRGEMAPRGLSGRGLAYWSNGKQGALKEERILYVTPGYRLVALDAKTGVPVPTFGAKGIVDLKMDDDQVIDLVTGEVGLHSAPTVAGDTIIIGAAHLPGGAPKTKRNVKGYVRGYDVKTGKRKWHYQLVHHPLWDMDISSAPLLVDIKVDGQAIKAVAQPTKQGFLYVFDRVTGKPVWPIDE